MVGASLLPFQIATGVKAPERPLSPAAATRDDFAGTMDDALGADRQARRADNGGRAPRRSEPARPREVAESREPAPARRAAGGKPQARHAERADECAPEENADRAAAPSTEGTAAAGQADAPQTEAKTNGEAAEPAPESDGDAAVAAVVEAVAEDAVVTTGAMPLLDGEDADADAADAEDLLARGRRWVTQGAEQAEDQSETSSNAVSRRAAGAPGGGVKVGHALQQARADGTAATGQALGDLAQETVAAAHAEAAVNQPSTNGVVTQAVETAANAPQTASAADAATAIERAMSAVETVATAEAAADTNTAGSETHEQGQPKPQAPAAQANGATVSVGGADGVRFTVNSAAGSAAYSQAAPRGEEAAVLPQIVQSIRLHAVQGTTEARVQLKPEHLGNLNITLKVEHNRVTATIQADVAAVRAWIESHESSLRQALSEQGLELARLVVHPDGQQASEEEQHRDRPRRQPRRRSWRDEDATFEVLV